MRFLLLFPLMVFLPSFALGQSRPSLTLESGIAQVDIDLGGGSISSFTLGPGGVNPLSWDSLRPGSSAAQAAAPRSMGHFLCLDRWGPPTEAEQARGMGFHGEAPRVWWEVAHSPVAKDGWVEAEMSAALPLAGLTVSRKIRLMESEAVFTATEAVTNTRHLGRIYNLVQHPSIGSPFLDESTIVDSNATRGFMQDRPLPNPEETEAQWPNAIRLDGESVDLRYLKDDHSPPVVSFAIDSEYGWIVASSPNSELLIGYLWRSEEHPWVNVWRNVRDGKPRARGLEFGTTGLHQPGPVLVEKGKIFDRPLFRFIDADETQHFSYACFMAKISSSWKGTRSVDYDGSKLIIEESGDPGERIELKTGSLFD